MPEPIKPAEPVAPVVPVKPDVTNPETITFEKGELTKKFSSTWNEAKDSGRNEVLSEIEKVFGTRDLTAIKPAEVVDVKKQQAQWQEKLSAIESENKTLKENMARTGLENSIKGAFESLNLRPRKSSTAMSEFLNEFEIKSDNGNQFIFKRGSSVPLTDGRGGAATITDAVKTFAESQENSFLFMSGGGRGGHISDSLTGSELPKGFLKNPANVDALRKTGQLEKAFRGESVDMEAVKAELQARSTSRAV